MSNGERIERTELEAYERPTLTDYGVIEEWTRGPSIVNITIIVG